MEACNGVKKNVKHIEDCKKAFEIQIASDEVVKRIEDCYTRVKKVANIPGFRAGKAPRDLLEKHYGERVTKEVVEDLIADSYQTALEESGFTPLGMPSITDVKLDDKKSLSYKAEFDIRPSLSLKGYKGIKITKKKAEIKDEDIEKSIKTLQDSNAKFKDANERAVKIGDYCVCDSEVFVDDKSIVKKRESIWMPIEEKSYIPGLSAQLTGARAGDEKNVNVTLPEDFNSKEYAGRPATFKIKVKEIKERTVPQIDDEFAKDLGYNDLVGLKESVRKILENQAERQIRQDMENQILEKLLKSTNFTVPSSLVEKQHKHLITEEERSLMRQGLKEDDIKTKKDELEKRLKPIAVRQVKTMFILDEIAHKETITVSDEEMDQAFESIAQQARQPKNKVEKHYKENKLTSSLRADIENSKVLDFLVKEATIEEEKK